MVQTNQKKEKHIMSCSYRTTLGIKFKTEADKALATVEIAEYLRNGIDDNGIAFNAGLETFASQGVTLENFDMCVDVVLAGWKWQKVRHGLNLTGKVGDLSDTDENGYHVYSNEFDASCGWLTVMTDFFNHIAKHLCDGSYFEIDHDDGYVDMVVEDGLVSEAERGNLN